MHKSYLQHHGILGQRWGIRRFQNRDGTLTAAGKVRKAQIQNDIDNTIEKNRGIYDRIKSNGIKIQDFANELGKKYENEFKKVELDKKQKNDIDKKLYEAFGAGCDDEELYEMVLDDLLDDAIMEKVNNNLSSDIEKFDKLQDDYWKDIKDLTDGILDKYSNTKVIDSDTYNVNGKIVAAEIFAKELDDRFTSYIGRHFRDYWVNDTDAKYDALKRLSKDFTLKDYNAKYSRGGK